MDGDVQFEEEDLLTIARPVSMKQKKGGAGFITRIAISTGLAKDEKQAQVVLAIVAGLLLVAAVIYYVVGNNTFASKAATPDEVQQSLYPAK